MGRAITVNDMTPRDGEQSAGVAFTIAEKLAIARVALSLKARLMGWGLMTDEDIDAVTPSAADIFDLSIPISDIHIRHKLGQSRDWVFARIQRALKTALETGCEVSAGAEDALHADLDFLVKVAETARAAGA